MLEGLFDEDGHVVDDDLNDFMKRTAKEYCELLKKKLDAGISEIEIRIIESSMITMISADSSMYRIKCGIEKRKKNKELNK